MINDAQVVLAGFVASAPSFRRTVRGTSAASLRVAYTPRHINRETGEWADGETSFVTVLCYRTLADNVAVCLRKGEPVLVKGRLRVRPYKDREDVPRIAVEVDAQSVGHDLNRGVAHFSRTHRAAGETAAESSENGGSAAAPVARSAPDGGNPAESPAGSADGAVLDERALAEFVSGLGQTEGEDPVPGEAGVAADDGSVLADEVLADDVPVDGSAVPF